MNPIRTDTNDFAKDTFARRLPQLIRDIQSSKHNNLWLSADMKTNLDTLYEDLVMNTPLPAPRLAAPDSQAWLEAYKQHQDQTWQATEFLFGETYFYYLINEIIHYWEEQNDPYHESKQMEMDSPGLGRQIAIAQTLPGKLEEQLPFLLNMSLWGNRVDLSLPEVMKTQTQDTAEEDLLVDERHEAVERLLQSKGTVHLITDNFGTELAMDLALADALLALSIPVTFHVKMYPTYVSDATMHDALTWMLGEFALRKIPFAQRLKEAWLAGRFKISPNFFWNSPYFLDKLPENLMKLFADANLLIFKGDVNYRRAFLDSIWPVDKPASEIVNYLPAPALFLRTLKSDCLAGVPKELAENAEAANPNWRRLGKYGLIQYVAL